MTGETRSGLRRIGVTLIAYAGGAALLLWAAPAIQRTFLLPTLFSRVLVVALALAAPVVAAVAWRYPELGDRKDGES